MKKLFLLCCLFIGITSITIAQQFPIAVSSLTVKNQLPADVGSWSSIPGNLILTAQGTGGRTAPATNLVVQIRQGSNIICGNTAATGIPVDSFKVRSFQSGQLLGALSSCRNLTAGNYMLYVVFMNNGKQASPETVREFTVASASTPTTGSPILPPTNAGPRDTARANYQPPRLISPIDGKQFSEMEAKGIFKFSWTNVIPLVQGITYELNIYQIPERSNATQAVNGIPLYTQTVTGITQLSIPANKLQLEKGKNYAWNVKAVNTNRQAQGGASTNYGGPSESWSFRVGVVESNSGSCLQIDTSQYTVKCVGKTSDGKFKYEVRNLLLQKTASNSDPFIQSGFKGNGNSPESPTNYVYTSNSVNYQITNISPVSFVAANSSSIQTIGFDVISPTVLSIINVELNAFTYFINPETNAKVYCEKNFQLKFDKLSPCPCDFCEEFDWGAEKIGIAQLTVDKNTAKIPQSFNIKGTNIKQIKADIIGFDWQVNEDCKKCLKDTYGYFLSGSATGEKVPNKDAIFPSINGNPLMNSNELQWNLCANQKATSLNGTLNMLVALPPQTSLSCCTDEFKICIRYTVVTEDCRTCTKVICYTFSRTHGGNSKPENATKTNQSN